MVVQMQIVTQKVWGGAEILRSHVLFMDCFLENQGKRDRDPGSWFWESCRRQGLGGLNMQSVTSSPAQAHFIPLLSGRCPCLLSAACGAPSLQTASPPQRRGLYPSAGGGRGREKRLLGQRGRWTWTGGSLIPFKCTFHHSYFALIFAPAF